MVITQGYTYCEMELMARSEMILIQNYSVCTSMDRYILRADLFHIMHKILNKTNFNSTVKAITVKPSNSNQEYLLKKWPI